MDKQLEINQQDPLPIVAEQKKVKKKEGRIVSRPGHTVFEYNYNTKEIKQAEHLDSEVAIINGKDTTIRKVKSNENCIYFQCLNKKSVWKRVWQMGIITDQTYLINIAKIKLKK